MDMQDIGYWLYEESYQAAATAANVAATKASEVMSTAVDLAGSIDTDTAIETAKEVGSFAIDLV